MTTPILNKSQQDFNERYISSNEITKFLDVPRTTISVWSARGKLPEPIKIGLGVVELTKFPVLIWERAEIMPVLNNLKEYLTKRRTQK